MFLTTEPVLLFDHLRIPYRVVERASMGLNAAVAAGPPGGFVRIVHESATTSRAMVWPSRRSFPVPEERPAVYRVGDIPFFARVVDPACLAVGAGTATASEVAAVTDERDRQVSAIWCTPEGSVILPFDPSEAIDSYWSEAYLGARRGSQALTAVARRTYYRLRPIVPRPLQIAARREFSRVQALTRFPRWPVEPALHDLVALLYRLLGEVADEPVPWIAPWPRPHDWALVLTHDVEGPSGYGAIDTLRAVEQEAGLRSSWNFVARRYDVEPAIVQRLRDAGCEVGVHGLYHDGRDLASAASLASRLPEMRAAAERWGAIGFRSPGTQRARALIEMLPFDYDSSYPDADPYEPQPGGCCSWLPFHIGDVVELPITLPQDHTLFVILRHADEAVWLDKARLLRERGGMALMLTHPDYMVEPGPLAAYRRFLAAFADDATAWRALPREVSAWWRDRSTSSLVRAGTAWRIDGPAADAGVVMTTPPR